MIEKLSRRQKLILAALASEPGASYAPVQVQKLFFLLDENVPDEMGGKLFGFQPYDYGPFDRSVYDELEALERLGLVQILFVGGRGARRKYGLSTEGFKCAQVVRSSLSTRLNSYFDSLSAWIRGLSFAQLVGSVYQAYPNMRVNSIFRD